MDAAREDAGCSISFRENEWLAKDAEFRDQYALAH